MAKFSLFGCKLPPKSVCIMLAVCAWMAFTCSFELAVLPTPEQLLNDTQQAGMPLTAPYKVEAMTTSAIRNSTMQAVSLPENSGSHDATLPPPLEINPNTSIVVLVLSARTHWEQRMAIRRTWGSTAVNASCQIYFVIDQGCEIPKRQRKSLECALDDKFARAFGRKKGGSNTRDAALKEEIGEENMRLIQEQLAHLDLIITDRAEAYRGLPNKLKVGYSFVTTGDETNSVKWVVKADDDMYLRLNALKSYLSGSNLTSSTLTVVGRIKYQQPIVKRGKWAEIHGYRSKHILSNGTAVYPPFPLGSAGHVVSRPVAEYVASRAANLSDYQGEDVSLGIWLDSKTLDVTFHKLDDRYHDVHGACERLTAFLVGHQLTSERLEQCWTVDPANWSTEQIGERSQWILRR